MEFDIVNEIMTASIGSLFQSKVSVQNFFAGEPSKQPSLQKAQSAASTTPNTSKTESKKTIGLVSKQEAQDSLVHKSLDSFQNLQKLDPPSFQQRSVSNIEKEASSGARKNRDSSDANPQSYPRDIPQSQPSKSTPYTIENWINKDGPQKLMESLNRLNLNINNINKVSLSALSAKQLEAEKKSVKQELKRYDAAFIDIFKRMPNREEKEPMRPLYIYYKRVKQFLDKAESEDKGNRNESSRNQSLGNVSVDSEKNSRSTSNSSRDGGNKARENKNVSSSVNLSSGRKVDSSFEEQLSVDNLHAKGSKQDVAKKQETKITKEEAQKRLEVLDVAKTQLREKLHAYQLEFTKNNNRKIKYHKDIIPVEEDYKRYKDVKDEMQSLEEFLKSQQ